ncbi:MAG: YkvA family protein [bacterium]
MRLSLKASIRVLRMELAVVKAVYLDPRTPRIARWLLGLALAYVLSPIDLIPDFIPVLGHLDDLIVVPALVVIAFWMVPQELYREHRERLEPKEGSIAQSPSDV